MGTPNNGIYAKSGGLSRREFLKDAGLIIGGAAIGSMTFLNSCKGSDEPTGSSSGVTMDPYTVNLLYYNCDHMTPGPIGYDLGIYRELGVNVNISGNGNVPTAFAAGQGDIGYVGVGNIEIAAAGGAPLTVVADNFLGGSYYLVVANNIESPEELLGKRLALGDRPEINNSSWVAMANALDLPIEGDNYQTSSISGDSNKFLALAAGQIDGYTCCDPWGSMAVYEKIGKAMGTFLDVLPGNQKADCCGLTMNDSFIKNHRALAVKMVLGHTRAIEAMYIHPLKSALSFAKTYGVPLEVAMMTVYRKTNGEGRMMTWDMHTEPNIVTRLDNTFNYYKDIGMTQYQTLVPATTFVDSTLLDECGANDFNTFITTQVDPVYPLGMSYDDWYKKALETDV